MLVAEKKQNIGLLVLGRFSFDRILYNMQWRLQLLTSWCSTCWWSYTRTGVGSTGYQSKKSTPTWKQKKGNEWKNNSIKK